MINFMYENHFSEFNWFSRKFPGASKRTVVRDVSNQLYSGHVRVKDTRDTINVLQLFVEKRQFFNQNNQWLSNNNISLNRQLIVLLNSIICFSERFCDISLLVLKMRFQVFFRKQKDKGFPCDRKILMPLLSVLFNLQNHVSVFSNFVF